MDLGRRGVMFTLLGGQAEPLYVFETLGKPGATAPVTLKLQQYPMFVRFRDPADPKTVENLLEFKPCPDEHGIPNNTVCLIKDRFAEAFGAGVALKSVTIEMTDEPVTVGNVIKSLPWLPEYYGRMFDGSRFNTITAKFKFANKLSSGAFSTELSPYGR